MITLLSCITVALHVIDWLQTRYIAKHPAGFYELNPFLGKHPSVLKVNMYFLGCIASTLVGASFLPFWWAIGIGTWWIALETFLVIRNYKIGIRFA